MTVSTENAYSGPYLANGVTTVFPFTFTAPTAAEVSVLVRDAAGNEVAPGVYSVSINVGSGGSITFDQAPVNGLSIIPVLDPEFTQDLLFEDGSAWLAAPVNEGYDRSALRDQVLRREVDRAILVPLGESPPAVGFSDLIEGDLLQYRSGKLQRLEREAFAGKYYAGDATGKPIPASGTGGGDASLRGDLAQDTGAGMSGFSQSVDYAPGDVGEALKKFIGVTDEPFAADPAALDNTAAINAAIAAANGRRIYGPKGPFVVTGAIDDDLGADFDDSMQVKIGDTLYNTYARREMIWDTQTLWYWYALLINGDATAKIVFSGDSTTECTHLPEAFRPHKLIEEAAKMDGFQHVACVNNGHGGKDTGQWVSDYLAADIAENAQLYVVSWGINDPYNGRTLEQFAASLWEGVEALRTAHPLGTASAASIILMVPSSTADTPNGRDEFWYEEVAKVYRRVARAFDCCYIDKYALWQNSRSGANYWLDDPFADGRGIHPNSMFNTQIFSKLYDVLFPSLFRIYFRRPIETAAALQNGWVNFDASVQGATFSRDRNRIVRLAGVIKNGGVASDTLLFTLPDGYRPRKKDFFVVGSQAGAAMISIDIDGSVRAFSGLSATYTMLGGVTFQAAT